LFLEEFEGRIAPSFSLGAAANYAVLFEGGGINNSIQLVNARTNVVGSGLNQGNGIGNIGVGGAGLASVGGPSNINGSIDFSAANTGQLTLNGSNTITGGVNYGVSAVTSALNTVNSLNSTLGALPGTSVAINGNTTINAASGTFSASGPGYTNARVFTVSSFLLNSGDTITINGNGTDSVIINLPASLGSANFAGSVILNGISPDNVIFNVVGGSNLTGGMGLTLTNNNLTTQAAQGIFLNPNGPITINGNTNIVGRVFGGDSQTFQFNGPSNVTAPLIPSTNDVSVTKTDGVTSVVPGTSVTYTIVVSNSGPAAATNVAVSDPLPTGISTFTWSGNGQTNVSGPLNDTIASLASGASVTYTVTARINPSATGSVTNTVTATAANDSNPNNNSASDTNALTPRNDVGVTKTDGVASVVPGTTSTYTIVVSNTGPSTATNVAVSDPLPPGVSSFTWSGNGQTNVSGALSDTIASLAPGATVTYTITALINPSATGSVTNTVNVTAANDTNSANNSASDTDTLTPRNDVSVTKSDGRTTAVPGTAATYTIVVSNSGPSTATNVAVSDSVPTGVTSFTWSGNGQTNVSGALNNTIASLAPGATVTYTVTALISPSATGSLTNTVTVTVLNDTNPNNNTASDTDTLTPQNDVGVTKTDGVTSVVPGQSTTYTIVVSNNGPSTATNVAVSDPLPAGVTSFTWSGNGHTNVSGALTDTIASLAPGASITYTVTAQIGPLATGSVTNTVTVTAANDTNSANNSASDTDTLTPQNDVGVTKTDGVTSAVPGQTTTYTIVVSNSGPSAATNVAVSDPLPAGITSFTWSGNGQTNVSGSLTDTIASLAPGATVTYTVVALIDPATTGSVTNTVTVTAANDTNAANNSASDTDTLTPKNDTGVTKTDGVTSAVPGNTTTYTIVVSNSGPSTATNVAVSDPLPTGITSVTWSGNGHTNVSGPLTDTIASLAPSANVTYTVVALINPSATGSVTNTVTVTAANDTSAGNNSASDTDTLTPQNDVGVTKSDGAITAVPGSTTTYTIVVTNSGPSTATNVAVSDPLPTGVTSFTWSGNGQTNVSGPLSDTIASLAPGATVTYTVTALIDPSATGFLTNTVTVTAANDTNPNNNSDSDTDILRPQNDVGVTKTDGVTSAVPGATTIYTIVVSNSGPSTATNVGVSDPLPPRFDSFTWSGNGQTNVSGPLTDTIVSLAPGATVTYTVVALISPSATGSLTNTVLVTADNDTNLNNNTASDTNTLTPQVGVSVTKTDGVTTVVPGTTTTYTIVVTNTGPSTATNVAVSDLQPMDVISTTWSGDGQINVAGSLSDTIVSLASGASVTYTVTALIDPTATGELTNTVTVTAPNNTNLNSSASDTDLLTPLNDVTVTKTDGVTSVVPGQSTTYTIVVSNNGPSAAHDVVVTDPLPAGVTSFTWSGNGQTNVSGPLNDTIHTLSPGQPQTVTYTVTAVIDPSATGTITNTVTVTAPDDTDLTNNTASDVNTVTPQNDVGVTKTDGVTTAVPGSTTTYTIVVSNSGPSTATQVTVNDPLPVGVNSFTWSGNGQTNVTGPLTDTITSLASGASVTYTVVALISPSATGSLTNTVTVAAANDANLANNTASDTNTLTPKNDVGVTKTDGVTSVVPGQSTTYTIVVSNSGPSTATTIAVSDPLPAGITSFTWSGNGHTNVSGSLTDTIASLAPGATITYTVTALISPSATGSVTNAVTVTTANDTNAANNSASDTNSLTPENDVGVTKTDGVTSVVPGTTTTYTIVVTNTGPSTATNVVVSDPLPPGITSFTWSGNGHTNVSGALNDTIAGLAPGATVTYTIVALISPSATGSVTNTVTVTAANDTNAANNSASDTDTLTPRNDVGVIKTDGTTSAVPGSTTTYTIVVSNTGPSTATSILVSDPLPANVTSFTWSGNGNTNVVGPLTDTIASLAPGATVTYTVTALINPSATGSVTNTVTVTAANDTNAANNSASDTDSLTPQNDVGVTKTDGSTTAVPGTTTTYTIVVSNTGPSTATNVAVSDPLPPGIISFTWSGNGHTNVSGPLTDTITSLAPGATVTYTVVAQISTSATGSLTNTVTVTAANDTNLSNNTASDIDSLTPQNDVNVTKTDGVTSVVPGTSTTYTIVVSNSGPSTATDVVVSDPLPLGVTSFTWTGNGQTSVSGPLADTISSLAPGTSVTYTVTALISPSATGSLTNTVAVTAANDTNLTNNTASDTNTLTPENDVGVTKDDGATSVIPGTSTTYTIIVTNTGPSTATNVVVSDPLPSGVSSFTWSGNGQIDVTGPLSDTIASLTPGAAVTYTVTALIDPNATGSVTNTVTVTAANDTNVANNTASDTDTLTPQNDVGVTKTDGVTTAVPGSTTTYTIVVSNTGLSTATDVVVSDPLPAGFTSFTWSGNGQTNVSGPISDTIASLAPGATTTYTVTALIDPNATGNLTNAVAVTAANDSNTANNSASDTNTLTPQNDVGVTKTDGVSSVVPGTSTIYTIVVTNTGPSTATGVAVSDPLPLGVTSFTWSGNGQTNVSGALTDTIASLAPGASATYTVTALISPSATGTVTNTVTVTAANDTNPANNSASDTDTLTPQNDVAVTKTDGVTSVVPGQSTTYTIVVSNTGPSTATNVAVSDPLPAGITSFNWSGNGQTNVSGPLSDTIASLAPGATITYTVKAPISPSATGDLTNTVTVTATNDTNTTNNSASDTNTLTPENDVGVTKTDGVTSIVPGNSTTYTIVVTNTGPSTATNVVVSDPLPPGVTSFTWSGDGHSNVSGPLTDTIASVAPGTTVTYTVTALISPSATGSLTNTVTVTAADDTNLTNNTASDTNTLTPQNDVGVTKTDGISSVVPGTTTTYTIVVTNTGPSTATNVAVSDPLPAGVTSFTWSGHGHTNVSGPLTDTIIILAPGASVTYTVTALISPSATGSVTNTVTVAAANDTNAANNSASDTDTLTPQNDVGVTKTDGVTSVVAGQSTTYTIVVSNTGSSTATNIAVSDPLPVGFTSFTWSGNGHANVSGSLTDTIASLAPGATITYTVTALIDPSATGSVTNTVTVTAANDTNPANNVASDTNSLTLADDVGVNKTDGVTSIVPGTTTTYTIVVSNSGPGTATNVAVSDPLPPGITSFTWSGNGHTNIPGALTDTIASLAPGATVTYTVVALISPSATGSVTNTVTVTAANDTNPSNNSASDTNTLTPENDVGVTKTDGATTAVPGSTTTYTIVVSNTGPSTATNVVVKDPLPPNVTSFTWSGNGQTNVVGPLTDTITSLAPGATITYTITALIDPGATGDLTNTVTVTAANDINPNNNRASDTDTLTPRNDVRVTKTDGVTSAVPGTPTTYTMVVTNTGPSTATNVAVSDPLPPEVDSFTWSGNGQTNVSGSLNDTIASLAPGASVTYTVTALIDPSATGDLTNTVMVTAADDTNLSNDTASDTNNLTPMNNVVAAKSDGVTTAVPGTTTTYTIVVTNIGPSTATNVVVDDPLPLGVDSFTWSGNGQTNVSGPLDDTIVSLAPGAAVTYTLTALIEPNATGELTNVVTVTAPNNTNLDSSASDTDTLTPQNDVAVTKTDGVTSVVPGESTTYTIVVSNSGPSTATNVVVSDLLPPGVTFFTWSGNGQSNVSGPLNDTIASLAPGATITYTVTALIDPNATGSLTNTVEVTAADDTNLSNNTASDTDTLTPQNDVGVTKSDGVTSVVPGQSTTYTIVVTNTGSSTATEIAVSDPLPPASFTSFTWSGNGQSNVAGPLNDIITSLAPGANVTYTLTALIDPNATGSVSNTATVAAANDTNAANNSASDTNTLTPENDVGVTKTDGVSSVVPGTTTTYTIVVTNTGPSTATDVVISDPLPATGFTSFTWSGNGQTNVSGPLSDTIASLAPGAIVTYTLTALIDPNSTGSVTNTVTVAAANDTNAANNSASDSNTLTPQNDVGVTKTDGVSSVVPGQSTTYTIVVSNIGPSVATNVAVSDPLPPAGFASFTWSGNGHANVSGPLTDTIASLAPGATVIYTLTALIDPNATGSVTNTVTVAAANDTNAANDSASDTDTLTPQNDVSVTKTDGAITAVPGSTTTYTIVVSNTGPSTATDVTVSDPLPPNVTSFTWSGNGQTNVSGALSDTIASLAPGAAITYTVTALIDPNAAGDLTNTVTVTAANDTNTTNNTASDTNILTPENDVGVTKTDGVTSVAPGQSTTYTIVVTNTGPSTATNVVVSDPLPPGVTSFSWSGNGQTNVSGALSDSIASLAPGASITYTVTALISPSAIGLLNNTVTVTAADDTNLNNNMASDINTLTPQNDVGVTKTDGVTSVVPGQITTYTIVVTNTGPSTAINVAVSDPLPPGAASFTWSGNGQTNVSGPISDTIASLAPGASVIYTVTALISPSATGSVTNTVTVSAAGDTNANNNTASDTNTLTPQNDVGVTKADGVTSVVPGTATTYTIVVNNTGPSTATNVAVSDPLPPGFTSFTWSGNGHTNVSGPLTDTIASLAPGATVTYTLTALIDPNATVAVTNTVTVTAANDTNAANNSASDTDALTPQNDVGVTKTDGVTTAVPGSTTTYTIVVSNTGPSTATEVLVSDPLPPGVDSFTWSGNGQTNVSGPLSDTIASLAPGASVSYTVTALIDPNATGSVTNAVTVTAANDTNVANNSASDTNTLTPQNDIGVTKTDGVGSLVPGQSTTYTIVVSNTGPSTATNVMVSDPLPAGIASFVWTGNGETNVSGPLNDTIASLAPGSTITYTVTAFVDPKATGDLTNTVTVTAANDTNSGNNSASDSNTLTPQNDVGVTKTDGVTSVVPGQSTTYTIAVSNTGPSTATNVAVSDPLPLGVTSFTWSGNGQTNVSGALSDTIASLAPGATVTYTVTALISPSATGLLTNTVTVVAADDTNLNNNTASDTNALTPQNDVGVTKTDGVGSVIPGQSTTYTIVVTNAGPSTATKVVVNDPLPPGVTSFTWSGNGQTNVSGPLSDTIASLAPGATMTYTVTALIDPNATGSVTNTVSVTAANDTNAANNSASDTNTLAPQNDVGVTKTDGVTIVVPGSTVSYTIVVNNSGPSTATSVVVSDPLPPDIASFTWSGNGQTNVSGPLSDTIASLAPGATISYTVTALIDPNATGDLTNTVTVMAANDTNPNNNTASATNTLTPQNDVGVTKSDGVTSVVPGESTTYTIVVSNAGPSTATDVAVSDPLPLGVTSFTWSGNGQTNVSGPLSDTIASLAPGATVTYTVVAQVSPSATGSLINVVTVSAANDTNSANNSATDTDTLMPQNDVGVTKTDGVSSVVPGTSTTYTIVVSNTGPSTATQVVVRDPLPPDIASFTWSGNGQTNVSGPLSDTIASLAPGATISYTVTALIDPNATGDLTNAVTVTAANDTNPNNNSASDSNTLTPRNDVGVTKTNGVASVVPGSTTTYTIAVTNTGPSTATNVAVSDPLPPGLTSFTWSGNGHANVSGPLSDTIASLAPGATVTYIVTAQVSPSATGSLTNTVTVTADNDTDLSNNTGTDTSTLTPQNDVGVTKTNGVTSVIPGTTTIYTIVVTNTGPSTATDVVVSDPLPPSGVVSFTWSGNDHTDTSGPLNDTITSLAPGASVTYTVAALIDPNATGSVTNTVTVSAANDTDAANNSASDTDTMTPKNDAGVTKTDGVASVVPGQSTTYTIVVSNSGPSTATDVAVNDPLPLGVTSFAWSGNGQTNVSGPLSDTIASLAPGATVTYTVTAQIDPSATGSVTNNVTVAAANDTSTANNSASDTNALSPQNDVGVTKTDGVTSVVPGTATTYTIVVSNSGPSTATNVAVSDPLPPGVTSFTWSGNGRTNVAGPLIDTIASLAPGATVTYTVIAVIDPNATGDLSNEVSVTAADDTNPSNDTATDTNTLTPRNDVGVTKTDSDVTVVPGSATTYTIVVSNSGPSTATNVAVNDPLPPGITSFTWSGNGHTNVSGPLIDTIASLAPNAPVTYIVTALIDPSAAGSVTNTVTVTAADDTNPDNNTSSFTNTLTPEDDVGVTKSNGVTNVVPGTTTTYTIVVSNAGPSTATNVVVSDPLPLGVTSFTWNGNGHTNASGPLSDTIASLVPGATVTYLVTALVDPSAVGSLTNTVTVAAPDDTNPSNNRFSDTSILTPQNDVSVTKTDGVLSVLPGQSTTYTIVVSNSGPSTATDVMVSDPVPPGITSFIWSGNGHTNVAGSMTDTIISLAPGATVTYTVNAVISPSANAPVTNTVTVAAANDTNAANNSASDTNTVIPLINIGVPNSQIPPPGAFGRNTIGAPTPTNNTLVIPAPVLAQVFAGGSDGEHVADVASLSGFVFLDHNNNGIMELGEPGIPGVSMILLGLSDGGQAVVRTTLTGPDGFYIFDNLPPGTFAVVQTQPKGFLDGMVTEGWVNGVRTGIPIPSEFDSIGQIALPRSGQGIEYNFSELLPATISGTVYLDDNQNLLLDEEESGLPGVVIRLTGQNDRGSEVNQTVTTNQEGNFVFGYLRPGIYALTVESKKGVVSTRARAGSLGGSVEDTETITGIIVSSGMRGKKYDFIKMTLPAVSSGQEQAEHLRVMPEEIVAVDGAPPVTTSDVHFSVVGGNRWGVWLAVSLVATATVIAVLELRRKTNGHDKAP
jgi:uncharacterized repeat protein (TIGR01451 family)